MKHFLLTMGGTGSRLLESVIIAAAAGTLCDGNGQPISQLHILSLDTDQLNQRAAQAAASIAAYETIRCAMPHDSAAFHTALTLDEWRIDLSGQESTLRAMAAKSELDTLLLQTLFPAEDVGMRLGRGLRGHADAGMLLFAGALEQAHTPAHPLYGTLSAIQQALESGEDVRVMLCGAAFGATGSAGVCMLARYIRRMFAGAGEHLALAALLLTPYENFPDDRDADLRTRAALENLSVNGMLESAQSEGVLDGLWILGMPAACRTAAIDHDAHLMHWMASCCIGDFFACPQTALRGVHTWQTPDDGFTWNAFGAHADLLRTRYGALLRFAALHLCEFEPVLSSHMHDQAQLRDMLSGWYPANFRSLRQLSDDALQDESSLLDALTQGMKGLVHWFTRLAACMPVQYRNSQEHTLHVRKAAEHFRRVLEKAGRIYLLEEEIQRSGMEQEQIVTRTASQMSVAEEMLALTQQEYDELGELTAEQAALDRRIGGASKHRIMKRMQHGLERAISDQTSRANELRLALEDANRHIDGKADEQRFRAEREALFHMESHLQLLRAQHITLLNELHAMEKKQQYMLSAEIPVNERTIPACDLFDGETLLRLSALIDYQGDKRQRAQLRKEIEDKYADLVLPGDVTSMKDVLSALGKHKESNHTSLLGAFIGRVLAILGKEADA